MKKKEMEMTDLKKLVPSLTACLSLPDGAFADAALVWCERRTFEGGWTYAVDRNTDGVDADHAYPAPMLGELLDAIAEDGWEVPTVSWFADRWHAAVEVPVTGDVIEETDGTNPAETALRLWFTLQKVREAKHAQE